MRAVNRIPGFRGTTDRRELDEGWHLGHVRMSTTAWIYVIVALTVAWLADTGCLAASFAGVDASVPWSGVLLAYCAGQLAAMLPITPGGLGVVEGSLTLALVAFGGARQSTLAAVLLYRLISYWGVLGTGAVAYAGVRVTAPRGDARVVAGAGP